MTHIHPTALIDPKAEIAADVSIGAYSVIGAGVQIDSGTTIAPHVVIEGPTRIGKNNHIFPFASLGAIPQDKNTAAKTPPSKSATTTPSANSLPSTVARCRTSAKRCWATATG